MAGVRYQISFDDSAFTAGTRSLLHAAENMRPLMEIAGGIFENSTRHRFDTESGPGGIPWPPSWRAREEGGKTLQNKGLLRGSIISNVGDNFVETGVDGRNVSSKYAATHQFGAVIRPVKARALMFTGPDGKFHMAQSVTIPARQFMGIDEVDVQDLQEAFVDYLEGSTRGN